MGESSGMIRCKEEKTVEGQGGQVQQQAAAGSSKVMDREGKEEWEEWGDEDANEEKTEEGQGQGGQVQQQQQQQQAAGR